MLSFNPNLDYTRTPKYMFWKPFLEFKVPPAPYGHVYVPLYQKTTKAIYSPNSIASYPTLSQVLEPNVFASVINSANFTVKPAYFKYTCIRFILLALFFLYLRSFIIGILTSNWGDVAIYGFLIALCPFGMRLGGKQYLERMKKYEKVLNKALGYQNSTVLSGSGYRVDAGNLCLYLDFYQRAYEPPNHEPGVFVPPVFYAPGSEISLE